MDLFDTALLDEKKVELNQIFQSAIQVAIDEDPAFVFWLQAIRLIHPDGKGGNRLPHDVFVALKSHQAELQGWLMLNYPTKHWRPVGVFRREDFILSAH